MKSKWLLLVFMGLSCASFAQHKRVLFLGNSYTAANNLPNLVYELALSAGDTLDYDANTPGGYTLGASPNAHSGNANSLGKIRAGGWDFVVLQEQSQIPTIDFYKNSTMYPGARQLNDSIKAQDICSRTLFYMTWGRKNGGQQCGGSYCSPVFTDFTHMQDSLEAAYMGIANELDAYVAPVGISWKAVIQDTTINLHSADESHPNLTGSYLAACTFYATIWQKPSVGLSYTAGLNPALALYLQQKADSVVLTNLSLWNIGTDLPVAGFTWQTAFDTVQFASTASPNYSTTWYFGNGDSAIATNPVYVYDSAGSFTVMQVVNSGCASDTSYQTVTTSLPLASSAPIENSALRIFPNPGNSPVINLDGCAGCEYQFSLWDAVGKVWANGEVRADKITIGEIPAGIYWLRLMDRQRNLVKTLRFSRY